MRVIQVIAYSTLGFFIALMLFGIAQVFALSLTEQNYILEEQADALRWTGEYYTDVSDPDLQVHTYTTLCRGFVVIEQTGSKIISTGFGDLADEYTYVEDKPIVDSIASTSGPVLDVSGDLNI